MVTHRVYGHDYLSRAFPAETYQSECECCGLELRLHLWLRMDWDGYVTSCSMTSNLDLQWRIKQIAEPVISILRWDHVDNF
jgi:hypothetical protein